MTDAIHPVDEVLPPSRLLTLGLQHVLVMYAGAIAVPLIVGRALNLPPELRNRLHEIPTGKPIVVHCAAGYRSAAATSIIAAKISTAPVYDLSEAITGFMN